jgi:hypothetical protein
MFNAQSTNVGSTEMELIPKGTVAQAILVVKERKNSQSTGGDYVSIELAIQGGQYNNRRVFGMLCNPFDANNSEVWRQMGIGAITRILESKGVFNPEHPESYEQFNDGEFANIMDAINGAGVVIKVGIDKGKDGRADRNSIADWGSPNPASNGHKLWAQATEGSAPAPAPVPAAKAAAPAAAAAGKKPAWLK